jgi:hypothetical protein
VSIVEKIIHWFSPPEDTCAKGPTPKESEASRRVWREAIHGNRNEVQRMQALARESKQIFTTVHDDAHKVTDVALEGIRTAEEAIRILEASKRKNEDKNK